MIEKLSVLLYQAIKCIGESYVANRQAERAPQGETDLSFAAAELPFTHEADLVDSLPFLGSAALDIDGDGIDELFLGGGKKQADQMFAFRGGKFVALPMSFTRERRLAAYKYRRRFYVAKPQSAACR